MPDRHGSLRHSTLLWSRELTKLGHEVRLMPAKDVKAYVKRNNDAADAEAICEAVRRPTMRFVRVQVG
jgi:transposase